MGKSTLLMAQKRQRAREAGLCITCCRTSPKSTYSVCEPCKSAASKRKQRRRHERSQTAQSRQALAINERAGDRAIERHFYQEATHYYQDALNEPTIDPADRLRLAEKMGNALLLSGDPRAAGPWFDRVLTARTADIGGAAKSVELLLQISRQLSIECKAQPSVAVLQQAIQLAKISNNARLEQIAKFRLANILHLLERDEEVATVMQTIAPVADGADAVLRSHYLSRYGTIAAERGDVEEAYQNFELALDLAKEQADPYRLITVWHGYAGTAHELGDISRAKACYEKALLVARQYRIAWKIPDLCLSYADLLGRMGRYSTAHGYLVEALAQTAQAPSLDVDFVCIGIPIAMQVGDDIALAKCVRPAIIDLVFQFDKPSAMGNVANAFARLYASQGHPRAARALLHRAFGKMRTVRYNLDIVLEIARQGMHEDRPRARALLEARTRLPHADIFHAGLALFDAFTAKRSGRMQKARMHANDAAKRFDGLQLYGYSQVARSLIPGAPPLTQVESSSEKPFAYLESLLTEREHEVAVLALKGFTNRQIADELEITPHTVEKHMSSIMDALGIRSRYQLAGLFEDIREG